MAVSTSFIAIVVLFVLYYIIVLVKEKKIMTDPREVITKFLNITLFYAGVSIIYFSFTGTPLLDDTQDNYKLYTFIIGFVALILTIPDLLSEFTFFKKFIRKNKRKNKRLAR